MTDERAIEIARAYGTQIVKIPDDDLTRPHGVIIVDLQSKPPTVARIDDEHPHLRVGG
jgi:hypothetical protein